MNSFEPLLDLELVRTLTVIVDTGGFTEAAKRLHRTQSAISMQDMIPHPRRAATWPSAAGSQSHTFLLFEASI